MTLDTHIQLIWDSAKLYKIKKFWNTLMYINMGVKISVTLSGMHKDFCRRCSESSAWQYVDSVCVCVSVLDNF